MGNRVTELLKAKRRQVRHLALVLVLALLVAAGVGGIFHLPAIAKTYQKTVLACTAVPPTGPGYAGFFVHVHNDDCFDENGDQVCPLPEIKPHVHDESCYTTTAVLVCTLPESDGHQHTEDCYTLVKGDLICEESTEPKYNADGAIIAEGHVHTDECSEWNKELSCGKEEGEGAHHHGDSCFEYVTTLTCDKPEVILHVHSDECYTVDEDENLQPRDPVVVVMGHVDHGKTSILDAIRNTDVTAGEAGGITQNIGAYRTKVKGRNITFLDTPGHAAFTAMRARGAKATDIAVIVVAADDGVMPQTVEAINHAKAADVQIIVAINKMDKPGANPDKVLNELTEHEIVPEQWGGDVICVPVSAKTKEGLPELLDTIILVADMAELKANPDRQAKGVVIEAKLDKGRGPVATFLVQKGTLHTGDIVVAGTAVGRVRVMTNEHGKQLDAAGPSVPVEVTGLGEVPKSGDIFDAVTDEKLARELVEQRKQEEKQAIFDAQNKVSLDNLFETIAEGEKKELKIIVKADVQGSVEAVTQNLQKLTNEEVKVNVIHGAVGGITESDVMLANASDAIIVGFNVRPDMVASTNAQRDGVDIRTYRIIYDCIDEIKQAMKGMLAPKYRDVDIGRAEVRQTINISAIGTIAGCYVLDGKVTRDAKIRLVRDGIIITETGIASLRRFKDDVKEVVKGYECGIGLDNYNDIKEGDIFEAYITEEYTD